ncbi:MAG: class I SAM-dependent methyltransferase [Allosphingosinicella sp.]
MSCSYEPVLSVEDGRAQGDAASLVTLNRLGRTSGILNEVNERFVALAARARQPVLDIGCATGVVALAALDAGATVVANDISPDHLEATRLAAPEEALSRLVLDSRRFPEELDFASGSLSHIHAANLLNFLTGSEIEKGLVRVADWLEEGGMFLSISGSPYARNVMPFIVEYERRRAEGDRWPGYCRRLHHLSDDPTLLELPAELHLLDPDVLARSATAVGLEVVEARFIHRRNTPSYIALDGQENAILIARKRGD